MPENNEETNSGGSIKEAPKHNVMEKWRVKFLAYAVVYLNFAFLMWYLVGYLNIAALISIWAIIVISGLFVLYAVALKTNEFISKLLPIIAFSFALVVVLVAYLQFFPGTTTDEMIIDNYAAYLTLHGINPYVNANMAGVFNGINQNSFLSTPLLAGGLVTYFEYPGLAALIYVPAVALGLPAFSVTVFFDIASLFLIFLYYRWKGFVPSTAVLVLVMALIAEYGIFSSSGVTDVIWVFFLGLSYVFKKKPWVSGIFYGLSIGFKQIPALIFPFFLYFIYVENSSRERSVLSFTGFTILSFLAVNVQFILANPMDWLVNVISIASQKIIGIGMGPSILSFTGVLPLPPAFFSITLLALTIALFFIYVIHFDRFKYGFFAFPVIILLLDYRSLITYMIYWPLLVLLLLPDFLENRTRERPKPSPNSSSRLHFLVSFEKSAIKNKRATAVLVVVLIFVATVVSAGFYFSQTDISPVKINNVTKIGDPYMVRGNVTYMQLNISYKPGQGDPASLELHYRVFSSSLITGGSNGMLWYGANPYVHSGNNIVDIYPLAASSLLPANTTVFKISAYSNLTSATATLTYTNTSFIHVPYTPIDNPTLQYLMSDSSGYVFPGWRWQSSSGATFLKSIPNGVILTSNDSGQTSPVHESLYSPIDYNFLTTYKYSLNLNVSATAGSSGFNFSNPWNSSYGPVLTFDNQYNVYIYFGGKHSVNNQIIDTTRATDFIYQTNQSSLNFQELNGALSSTMINTSNPESVVLSYVLNSQYQGTQTIQISNLSLMNGSAQVVPGPSLYVPSFSKVSFQSNNFNAFIASLASAVTSPVSRTAVNW